MTTAIYGATRERLAKQDCGPLRLIIPSKQSWPQPNGTARRRGNCHSCKAKKHITGVWSVRVIDSRRIHRDFISIKPGFRESLAHHFKAAPCRPLKPVHPAAFLFPLRKNWKRTHFLANFLTRYFRLFQHDPDEHSFSLRLQGESAEGCACPDSSDDKRASFNTFRAHRPRGGRRFRPKRAEANAWWPMDEIVQTGLRNLFGQHSNSQPVAGAPGQHGGGHGERPERVQRDRLDA